MTAEPENQEQEQNNEDVVSDQPVDTGPTPGQLLRAAREKRNLEPRDIAERLRLRLQIIELIEDDDYESFTSTTFVRGYLRSYAKALEIDDQEVFAAYDRLGMSEPVGINMQSFSRRKKHEQNDSRLMFISYAILVIVIGLAILWWWQEPEFQFGAGAESAALESEQLQEPAQTAATDEANTVPDPRSEGSATLEPREGDVAESREPLREDEVADGDVSTALSSTHPNDKDAVDEAAATVETDAGQANEDQANEDQAPVVTDDPDEAEEPEQREVEPQRSTDRYQRDGDAADAETAVVAPTTASAEATADDAELVLEFAGDCWVKIEDASGEAIAFGVKPAGYQMPLNGEAPYTITLGAPEVVSINFRGEAVDMSQFRSGRAASFTLPQQ